MRKRHSLVLFSVGLLMATWMSSKMAWSQTSDRPSNSSAASTRLSKRRVTVTDSIEMNRIAGSSSSHNRYTGASSSDFAVFSPDGKQFVIVVKRGNIKKNTNDYSMLLFQTGQIFDAPVPKIITSFSSSSNREGINNPQWLADNDTVLFLGEHPGETTQVYSVRCSSGEVTQLTHERTNVIAFSTSASGDRIVLGIENPQKEVVDYETRRDGYLISREPLAQLIAGQIQVCCQQLFVLDTTQHRERPLHVQGRLWQDPLQLNVSPDGRYLIVKTNVVAFPALWHGYTNEGLKELLALAVPKGSATSYIDRYEIIDIGSDSSTYLLDSPASGLSDLVWSPDSRSVIVAGIFLPLNVQDEAELSTRKARIFTVEIRIPQQDIVQIADRDLKLLGWDPMLRVPRFRKTRNENPSGDDATLVYYRKQPDRWENLIPEMRDAAFLLPDIRVEQDLNMPPRVVAEDTVTKRTALIFDLNPQFKDIDFGRVEDISWTGGGGRVVHGGLYLPPDYIRGRRYPLVIQTHGFDPHGFWIDGSFTTGFAAQTLAGKDIVVLQVPDSHDAMDTPEEAPLMVETYENAIDYLTSRDVIDREHIGIIGFSRTCFYVKYMLSHSRYRFTAAVADDGIDGGYFSYVAFPHLDDEYDRLLGSPPFGEGLPIWLRRSPGLLLDKVHTPLRVEANSPESLLEEWQWFAGLIRLGQPVEFVYLPEGDHILEKPWERLVSQQGNVDWLCFWLKDEEDPDRTKIEQYARWRNLRRLSGAN